MRQYRRSHEGSLFFFTLVTHQRRPILTTKLGRQCLRESFHAIREDHPFDIIAIVLLPDHLHAVWELPRGDSDYSMRWRLIKSKFTRLWRDAAGSEGTITSSRQSILMSTHVAMKKTFNAVRTTFTSIRSNTALSNECVIDPGHRFTGMSETAHTQSIGAVPANGMVMSLAMPNEQCLDESQPTLAGCSGS